MEARRVWSASMGARPALWSTQPWPAHHASQAGTSKPLMLVGAAFACRAHRGAGYAQIELTALSVMTGT